MTEPTTENKVRSMAIQMSSYEPLAAVEKEDRKGWVSYGNDNLYPNYLIGLYYNSPIHNALTNRISAMIQGKGSNTILDNALKGIAFDLKLQGQFVAEVIWNIDGTRVAKINHLPFENCRLAYGERDEVIGVWYSRDWTKIKNKKYEPKFIAKFDPSRSKECPNQCIYSRIATSGSLWYAKPDYYGALNYIELSHQMSLYHVNNILNGLFPSFIISMMNGIPTQEERTLIKNEWERKIAGAQNAGKFLMTFNEPNSTAPNITPFPISDADKQYEFLSEETAKQIMVAHSVTSPLLFGIRDNTGFGSNKDEMIVALDIFNHQVIQPYQRLICDAFEAILPNVSIELNSPFEIIDSIVPQDTPTTTPTTDSPIANNPTATVADVTYNGAQIASALDIVAKVKEGILTAEQAIVFLVQFLQLDVEVAKSMFATGGNAVAKLSEQKKKVECTDNCKISAEESQTWLSYLADKAEYVDDEEWELLSDEEVTDTANEAQFTQQFLSVRGYANPDKKDEKDSGLYKVRYYYSTNLTWKEGEVVTRDFCQEMVSLSKNGALFRYEDIVNMGNKGVNGTFAPQGERTYDIWTYKGGVYCRHAWFRKIFFRKKQGGKFLPNKGLKNDKVVNDKQANELFPKGIEAVRPNDMPNRASLKNK